MSRSQSTKVNVEEFYAQSKHKKGYKGFYQNVFKRLVDILACIVLIPFIMLLFIPVAIAIKVEDGGPVLYRSRRIGKNFKEFNMYKFRSMMVNAPDLRNEDGSTYNSKSDRRVTRVGNFIRETSIDELPQIFNVLFGQMSLVGPRAGDVESKDTYEDDEKDKTLVRPGITGYSQAYFRNKLGVREKRLYDACYAHNVTMWLDIKILFKTVETVLKRENVYTNSEPVPETDTVAASAKEE